MVARLEPPRTEAELAELVQAATPVDFTKSGAVLQRRLRKRRTLDVIDMIGTISMATFIIATFPVLFAGLAFATVGTVAMIGISVVAAIAAAIYAIYTGGYKSDEQRTLEQYLEGNGEVRNRFREQQRSEIFQVRSYRSGHHLMRELRIGRHAWYERMLFDPQSDDALVTAARWVSAGQEQLHALQRGHVQEPVRDDGVNTDIAQELAAIDALLEVGSLAATIEGSRQPLRGIPVCLPAVTPLASVDAITN
jgi:hypothetical protein